MDTTQDTHEGFMQSLHHMASTVFSKFHEKTCASVTTFEKFAKRLVDWQDIPFNIAIVGNSGAGKSKFINSIQGLTAKDKGAAAVAVSECTKVPKPYCHPTNQNLKLWDLPGVGTPNFPTDSTYLKKVNFERYDYFIILSCSRFTENDCWLAQQIKSNGKQFFFVRTKIDLDIQNDKDDYPGISTEEEVIRRVKNDILSNLENFCNPQVFLISCKLEHRNRWDFPTLCARMIENCPEVKKDTLVLTLDSFAKEIIGAKTSVLKKRTWIDATFAGVLGLPIPFLGIMVSKELIKKEVKFFKEQFGLSDNCLMNLSLEIGEDKHFLEQILKSKSALSQLSEEEMMIQEVMSNPDYSGFLKKVAKVFSFTPVVGGMTSFALTVKILHDVISEMGKEALVVLDNAGRKLSDMVLSNN